MEPCLTGKGSQEDWYQMSGETAHSENTLATTMAYKHLAAACPPLLTLIVGSQPQRTQPGLLINGLSLWFPSSALLCPRVTAASSREPLNNVFQSEHSDVCQAPCNEAVWSCLLVSFSQVFLLASLGAMQSITKAVRAPGMERVWQPILGVRGVSTYAI